MRLTVKHLGSINPVLLYYELAVGDARRAHQTRVELLFSRGLPFCSLPGHRLILRYLQHFPSTRLLFFPSLMEIKCEMFTFLLDCLNYFTSIPPNKIKIANPAGRVKVPTTLHFQYSCTRCVPSLCWEVRMSAVFASPTRAWRATPCSIGTRGRDGIGQQESTILSGCIGS